jgi:hypothetical protein
LPSEYECVLVRGVHRRVGGGLYVPVGRALIVGVGLELGTPRSGG